MIYWAIVALDLNSVWFWTWTIVLNMLSGWLILNMNSEHECMTQKKHIMFWTTVRSLLVASHKIMSFWGHRQSPQTGIHGSLKKKMVLICDNPLELGLYHFQALGWIFPIFKVIQCHHIPTSHQPSVPSLPPVGIHLPLHSQNGSDLTIQEKRWIKWETCVFLTHISTMDVRCYIQSNYNNTYWLPIPQRQKRIMIGWIWYDMRW